MTVSGPSAAVAILAAGLAGVALVPAPGRADEPRPPTIESALLRDADASSESKHLAGPREAVVRKPRAVPGYDQLSSALWSGGPNAPAALLANGADPDATSKDGEPILHYAVWLRRPEKLEDVLRAGADPNRPDKDGGTPLAKAIWGGDEQTVALLLRCGADPGRKRKDGSTDLDYAKQLGKKNIVALLEAKRPAPARSEPAIPPAVLRRPDQVFGSARFRAARGGQALAYSADGRRLIAGDERGGVRFFDARTGELRNVIDAHGSAVLGLAGVPNSTILVSSGADRVTRFWDTDTSQEVMRLSGGSPGLAVSPDGRLLFTGYHVWDVESVRPFKLAPRGRLLKDPDSNVGTRWSFFTPDNRYLVIGREASGVWAWDLAKDRLRRIKEFSPAAAKAITRNELTAAGEADEPGPPELLGLGSDQYTVVAAAPGVLAAASKAVGAVAGRARAMACSPDGRYLAALGYDGRIDVFDLENHGQKYRHDGHTAAVLAVAASPDGKLIASGGNDQTARVWDRATGKQLAEVPTGSFVYSVCFSPDGRLLAIGDNSSGLYLWDVNARTVEKYVTAGRVTGLAFDSRDGVLVSLGGDLHVLDVKTRTTRVRATVASAAEGPLALALGGMIVGGDRAASAGETFKVPSAWKLDGGTLTEKRDLFSEAMGHRGSIESVAVAPDGSVLAAASQGAIRLWDMTARKPIGGKMCGHTYAVGALRFSPDGKWLASASWDGTARVWEVSSGRPVVVVEADVDRVSGIDFTPDGQLVTANWDGTVHSWDLPARRAVPGPR